MTDAPGPAPAAGPPLHQFWWLHDARWYQGVARRFGQEAANEVNAEALRFVARRVAAWYAKEHGLPRPMPLPQLAEALLGASRTMWPEQMLAVHAEDVGEHGWDTVVTRNFALEMLRAAGNLDGYACPCAQLRAGWFEGFGARVADERLSCVRDGAPACRFRASAAGDPPAGGPGGGPDG